MIRKPSVLREGDTLEFIAPSGSLKDIGMVEQAAGMLRRHGFATKLGAGCWFRTRCPYAETVCVEVDPPTVSDGTRSWACHFPLP